MSKIEGSFERYLCDFCHDREMFAYEESWERLEDGRDRCVGCLIKQRDRLLKAIERLTSPKKEIENV